MYPSAMAIDESSIAFKDRLRRWRGKRYQKEVNDLLSVSLATIRKWESGKRTPTKLSLSEIERRMAEHPERP